MTKRTVIYTVFLSVLAIIGFGISALTAEAQYYNSYYNTSTYTYPYQYSYGSYQNNSSQYANYSDMCPGGYTVTAQGVLLSCNKSTGVYGSNFGSGSVLGASTTRVPGCLPGYIFSILNGQRCDDGNFNCYCNDGNLNGDDASIRNFDVRDGDDTDLEEGDDEAEIMEIRFDVEDGDIRLDRAEFHFEFTGSNNGEDQPWETFDEIRLLSDGREIESTEADDEDEWDEESNDIYSITFTGLDEIIRENNRADLTLEVDLNSNISGVNNSNNTWRIFVPNKGIRAEDADDETVYTGKKSDDVTIEIEN